MLLVTIRSKFFFWKQGRAPPPYRNKLTYRLYGDGRIFPFCGKGGNDICH